MSKFIRRNLDRHLVALVLGLGLLFLTYSWFQTQQRLARYETTTYEGQMRLDYQDNAIIFQRDSSNERPSITAPGGFSLLEYSDKFSTITVNGNKFSLWDGSHGYALDPEKHTLYHTITFDNWTLTQEVILSDTNRQIKINYYFLNPTNLSEVSLNLSHYHWYFVNPVVTGQGFSAEIRPVTRPEIESKPSNLPAPRYRISVSKGPEAQAAGWLTYSTYSGPQNQFGLYNLLTTFESRPVLANERTLVGSELVQWENLN